TPTRAVRATATSTRGTRRPRSTRSPARGSPAILPRCPSCWPRGGSPTTCSTTRAPIRCSPARSPHSRATRSARAAPARSRTSPRAQLRQKRGDWAGPPPDPPLAPGDYASPEAPDPRPQTLIRVGRPDEAISAVQWGVRLDPYSDPCHYLLGNGYTRRNYSQL